MLHTLDKIVLINELQEVVSDVVIQYAESNKSLHNWYNLQDVNVETFENIAWSRCLTYDGDISPDTEVEMNANNICFGENNGFWQVYFTHKSKNYKLSKTNCEFNLSQEDNNGTITISLSLEYQMEEESLQAVFQNATSNKCFSIVEGSITKRGVNISLMNNTGEIISDLQMILSEKFSMSSSKNGMDNDFSTTNSVKFTASTLDVEGITTSKDLVLFTCHKHSQHWQMRFAISGCFYEIMARHEIGMSFNLDVKHHGSDLMVSIFKVSDTSEIGVTFEINGLTKSFPVKKLKTIKEQIENIRKKSDEFNCPQLYQKYSLAVHKFNHALRILSRIGYKNFSKDKIFSSNDARLFYPSIKPDIHSLGMKLEKSKINVGKFLFDVEKEDGDVILSALRNVVFYLNSIKEIWLEITSLAKLLKKLMKNFENRKYGEDDDDNKYLRSVFYNLDLFDSMQITAILCEILDLVSFNEIGLSFKISNSEQMHEVSAELGVLALTLEDELKVWGQKVVTSQDDKEPSDAENDQVTIPSEDKPCFNMPKDHKVVNENLTSVQIQLIYESSLVKCAHLFQMVRNKLIECLHDISAAIHVTNRNVNISMITSSAVGLFGASLVITGLALTPFTAGLSSGLVAAGVGVGASGGVLGVGTSIADSVLTQGYLKSTLDLALVDRKVCKSLARLQDILTQNKMVNNLNNSGSFSAGNSSSSALHHPQYETKVIGECAANAISNFGVAAVKTGVHVAKHSLLRVGSVTVGVVFDVTSLAFRAVNLSKGGKSELGYKMEVEAQDLDKELEAILGLIEQMGVCVEQRNQYHGPSNSIEESTPILRPVLELI